jgi:type I restriction enzyme S subunit
MSWAQKRVPLGDLGEIVSGATPRTDIRHYWNGDIPWITPADLSTHQGIYFRGDIKKITKSGYDSCSTRMLPPGTILFSSRAPIGHSAVTTFPLCTNQGFKSIVPNALLDSVYGYFALKFFTPEILNQGRGATFAEVSKEIVENFAIPLPPLPHQQHIAAILIKADRQRRLRRYALRLSDSFPQSVFLEMFGNPAINNPARWKMKALRTISTRFSDGPFGSNLKTEHYKESGVRVIRLQNIGVGEFLDGDQAYVSQSHFAKLLKHQCLPGDVLIGTLGDPNLRACILPSSIPIALNKADCVQMRVDPQEVTAEYIEGLLNLPETLYLLAGLIHGQTRSRISMGQLATMEIPVPPLPLQLEFTETVRKYRKLRARQQEALRQAEHLFQTLLHQSFTGQLSDVNREASTYLNLPAEALT